MRIHLAGHCLHLHSGRLGDVSVAEFELHSAPYCSLHDVVGGHVPAAMATLTKPDMSVRQDSFRNDVEGAIPDRVAV